MNKDPSFPPGSRGSTSIQPAHESYRKIITKPNASNLSQELFPMLECESITYNNLLNLHFLWLRE
jgi:hypothetical protein